MPEQFLRDTKRVRDNLVDAAKVLSTHPDHWSGYLIFFLRQLEFGAREAGIPESDIDAALVKIRDCIDR